METTEKKTKQDEENKELIERFALIRKNAGLSQKDFGSAINLSQSQIGSYQIGYRNIPSRVIDDICRVFNVSKDWFLTGTGEMYTNDNGDEVLANALAEITVTDNEKLQEAVIGLCDLNDNFLDLVLNLINGLAKESKK